MLEEKLKLLTLKVEEEFKGTEENLKTRAFAEAAITSAATSAATSTSAATAASAANDFPNWSSKTISKKYQRNTLLSKG